LVSHVATECGVGEPAKAQAILGDLYRWWIWGNLYLALNRVVISGMHVWDEEKATRYLVCFACCAAFRGWHGWDRLCMLLSQGGWPRLKGYDKMDAKIIFVLMISLVAATEMAKLPYQARDLLFDLARCLVSRADVGGPWRVRLEPRLLGPKVSLSAVPAVKVRTSRTSGLILA
jgi:hypothetical protein